MKPVIVCLLLLGLTGCATTPHTHLPASQAIPPLQGSYHKVRSGETLWRIAHSYGLEVETLANANRLPSVGQLGVGQQLFIPLPNETKRFLWPVLGPLGTSSRGLEIVAPPGSLVRASRSGRVAVATHQLSGWGTTVVLDHGDGYTTTYAGLEQLLVAPGLDLRQGTPLGRLGSRALHFEIRYGVTPQNPLTFLPGE